MQSTAQTVQADAVNASWIAYQIAMHKEHSAGPLVLTTDPENAASTRADLHAAMQGVRRNQGLKEQQELEVEATTGIRGTWAETEELVFHREAMITPVITVRSDLKVHPSARIGIVSEVCRQVEDAAEEAGVYTLDPVVIVVSPQE